MVEVVAIVAGLLLGVGWASAAAFYLVSTRSYRQQRNLAVIGLGYLLIGILSLGSLFLLLSLCRHLGIGFQSGSHDASVLAYIVGTYCIGFFALRAEIRWRKSWQAGNQR
jgi:hypothetical protein